VVVEKRMRRLGVGIKILGEHRAALLDATVQNKLAVFDVPSQVGRGEVNLLGKKRESPNKKTVATIAIVFLVVASRDGITSYSIEVFPLRDKNSPHY